VTDDFQTRVYLNKLLKVEIFSGEQMNLVVDIHVQRSVVVYGRQIVCTIEAAGVGS
jgi:hypothetical protein